MVTEQCDWLWECSVGALSPKSHMEKELGQHRSNSSLVSKAQWKEEAPPQGTGGLAALSGLQPHPIKGSWLAVERR